jgi:hypothetical protein
MTHGRTLGENRAGDGTFVQWAVSFLPGILGGGRQFAYLKNVPITWTYAIEKESLRFEALEHVHIVKVEQLSRDMC